MKDRDKVSDFDLAWAKRMQAEIYPSWEAADTNGRAIQQFWDHGGLGGEYLGPERLAGCDQYINTFRSKTNAGKEFAALIRRTLTMKIRGKRTYGVMTLIGLLGLLFGLKVMPDVLTPELFAGIEATLLGIGGMTMRAGISNEASPRGIKK